MHIVATTTPAEREVVLGMCRREFRALQAVRHPNIVQLIGVIVDDPKSVSLLMELALLQLPGWGEGMKAAQAARNCVGLALPCV